MHERASHLLKAEQCRRRYQSNSLYRLLPGIFFTLLLNPSVGVGQQLPPGAGKEPFERICSSCHALNVATQTKRTHAGWEGTVETMRGRGASGSEADFDRIVQYLTDNFGPVNAPRSQQPASCQRTARDTEWITYGGDLGNNAIRPSIRSMPATLTSSSWPGDSRQITLVHRRNIDSNPHP